MDTYITQIICIDTNNISNQYYYVHGHTTPSNKQPSQHSIHQRINVPGKFVDQHANKQTEHLNQYQNKAKANPQL